MNAPTSKAAVGNKWEIRQVFSETSGKKAPTTDSRDDDAKATSTRQENNITKQ